MVRASDLQGFGSPASRSEAKCGGTRVRPDNQASTEEVGGPEAGSAVGWQAQGGGHPRLKEAEAQARRDAGQVLLCAAL